MHLFGCGEREGETESVLLWLLILAPNHVNIVLAVPLCQIPNASQCFCLPATMSSRLKEFWPARLLAMQV